VMLNSKSCVINRNLGEAVFGPMNAWRKSAGS
jgi:hypothetical protein